MVHYTFETDHVTVLRLIFKYQFFFENQIMNALVAASVRCFCCVHKFIDFAWVRKPFIFSLTHDLFWMDIQCSWVRRMSRMSHCDSEQKIKKMKQHFSSVLPHFFTRKQCHAHCQYSRISQWASSNIRYKSMIQIYVVLAKQALT